MTSDHPEPRTFGDRYVLGEQVTSGETREVWRAHDDVVGRQVALKIFFGDQAADPDWQTAFRRDADRLVALSHPGIAKVYEHGNSTAETWLAMAYVDGEPLSALTDGDDRPTAAELLGLIGQAAIALDAAHDAGIAHGALSSASLLVRTGDVVSVIGFAPGSGATRPADLSALAELADRCLAAARPVDDDHAADINDFRNWLAKPARSRGPGSAGDIGRTALALAASLAGAHTTAVVPGGANEPKEWPSEPQYDEAERKMVRNRLIILGAIVVIGGGVLLRFVGEGGGEVSVPSVVQLPLSQAQLELTSAGLRNSVVCEVGKDSGGTVASQVPLPGGQVKAGSSVVLTVTQDVC